VLPAAGEPRQDHRRPRRRLHRAARPADASRAGRARPRDAAPAFHRRHRRVLGHVRIRGGARPGARGPGPTDPSCGRCGMTTNPFPPGTEEYAAWERYEAAEGAGLLDELRAALVKYAVLPSPEAYDAVTCYLAATYAQPAWEHAT